MVEGQLRDSTRSIPNFFLHNENQSTIKIQTYTIGNPPKSDGADETGGASRILVWDTPRTTGRGGHTRIASIRTPEVTGIHRNSRWDFPWKRTLFTSDGPDSTTSGNDTPEGLADRPPDVEYSAGGPIHSDRDLLIQQLMETIWPPTPVAQERSPASDLETLLLNWLPVGTVTEEDIVSPEPLSDSVEGCFSCGGLTHTTDQCRTLDESFPFLPMGWVAEHIGDKFILGPGPPPSPRGHQTGNDD